MEGLKDRRSARLSARKSLLGNGFGSGNGFRGARPGCQTEIERRRLLKVAVAILAAGATLPPGAARAAPGLRSPWVTPKGTIRIGLLWSLTGHLSVIEKPSVDVGLFWVDRVNAAGGVAGLPVEPLVIDAKSDMKAYRQGLLQLVREENVLATFGGYTSASRRAVMPLVELNRSLFYYPTCYEGRECWQHIICTGPIANQHSRDLVPFMVQRYGPRAYFIGSNYVWPQESNRVAGRWLEEAGGTIVGEAYMPLGQGRYGPILEDVRRQAPDWIFSTVVGDSDLYLRQQFIQAGFRADRLPTASLTTSEMEVRIMGTEYGEGHILSAPYFQSLDNPTNHRFVDSFLNSPFGESGVTHYNMEETYLSFLFFQKAVERLVEDVGVVGLTPTGVRRYSAGINLSAAESPEGEVMIDPDNFNTWLTPKIGVFNSEGQVELLYEQKKPIRPEPYVLYPSRGVCRDDGLHLPSGKIVKAAS